MRGEIYIRAAATPESPQKSTATPHIFSAMLSAGKKLDSRIATATAKMRERTLWGLGNFHEESRGSGSAMMVKILE